MPIEEPPISSFDSKICTAVILRIDRFYSYHKKVYEARNTQSYLIFLIFNVQIVQM